MSSTGEGEYVLDMANTYSMGQVITHKQNNYTCNEPFEVFKEPVTQDCQDAFAAGDGMMANDCFSEMTNDQHEEEAQSVGIGMS